MKLGIISDTHSFLDPRIAQIFDGVEHILHAGDVGPHSLLLELGAIAPVTAVLGNTDGGVVLVTRHLSLVTFLLLPAPARLPVLPRARRPVFLRVIRHRR